MKILTILGIGIMMLIAWSILKSLIYIGIIGGIGYGVYYYLNKRTK